MVKRKNRLTTDAVREVKNTFSRFLSILVLCALAVAFLAGLRATAPDMKYTADNYYDRTHMMDGYVISTLGITDEDLSALSGADGVEQVEGVRTVDATATDCIVSIRAMPERLNLLEVVKGRLPQQASECVTDARLLTELGLEVGDTLEITLEEGDEDALARTEFTVVGTVICPLYAGTDRGTTSLGNGSLDGIVFVPGENLTADYYSIAYFTGTGLEALDSYSDEYEDQMEALVDSLEPLGDQRSQLRYDSVVDEAQDALNDAQGELDDAREEAETELADASRELADARESLDQGWRDYEDGQTTLERELQNGRAQLADAAQQLGDAQASYDDGLEQYNSGLEQYNAALAAYETNLSQYQQNAAQLDAQQAQLSQSYAQYQAALDPYVGTPAYDSAVEQMAEQKAQLDAAQAQIDEARRQLSAGKAQLDEAKVQLDQTAAQLASSKAQLDAAQEEITQGWADYRSGTADLERAQREGQQELADALAELEQGEADYADGQADYEEGRAQADEEIADAQAQLDDAQKQVDEIDECQWYVLGRNTNSGFVGYSQDAERVGNLASVFPIIFFLVAALACLTTMTRMVEDQRTQIGALKALGFSRFAISKKYLGYAFFASLIGGVLGLLVGCTLIPLVVANAFRIMYHIPGLDFKPQPALYVLSVSVAVLCTTGAGLWACQSTLRDTPANLMRPKAPKAGRRVFLERIRPLWSRLSFTWKVTVRNLLRYQKRFWMTVIGIGGCTALIVTGFGLHDSIFAILDKQFDEVSVYDATVGLNSHSTPEELAQVVDALNGDENVDNWLACRQISVDASAGSLTHTAYVFAVEDQEAFRQMIDLRERKSGAHLEIQPEGVVITEKLSELLDLEVGDTITLEGDRRVEATVTAIAENYVYHYVYMTESFYEQLFRESPEENVILLSYGDGVDSQQQDVTSVALMKLDAVSSYSYIGTIRDTFTDSMSAIDYAVVIIIVAAAALAFVVLYNLTNINITERVRELATLKVLGFYDGETTAYIYRENIFLTVFGILLGLVLGRFLHAWLVLTVEVDLVMFGRTAPPYAYWLAAGLTVLFSVIVNLFAHFRLKKVDMVESLKTVE
jgi:putative ABC transport system permease protein